jgi:hypothetical protein
VVGAPGVVVVAGGSELPEPIPVVVAPPAVAPGEPSVLDLLGEAPIAPVVVFGSGVVAPLSIGPVVVPIVPPVVFGSAPVVLLGVPPGVVAVLPAPRLVPPPVPRLVLPPPTPALPPTAEPVPPTPPVAPPLAPPELPAASTTNGLASISSAAATAVLVNRVACVPVMRFTCDDYSSGGQAMRPPPLQG